MEFFYREMRRRHRVLMAGASPLGDRWNFDPENRKALPPKLRAPELPTYPPDKITRAVMALVQEHFPDHFGNVEGFAMPVTAAQAEDSALTFFPRAPPTIRRLAGCHAHWRLHPVPQHLVGLSETSGCSIRWRCAVMPKLRWKQATHR